jgi:beta-galactosidase/beta-glucuronidase
MLVLSCLWASGICLANGMDLNYPRPDFRRNTWISLDGKWDFAFDDKDAGLSEKWFTGHKFDRKINVPYPYQAKLSGIGETEHHKIVWYSRQFEVPGKFAGKRVMLNFGAVDYAATVWINGKEAGKDEGGYVPFSFDITPYINDGKNDLVIRVFDDPFDPAQPRGKQRPVGRNRWHYTHITGIWQPVWLEAVPESAIESFRITPRLEPCGADITVDVSGGNEIRASVLRDGKKITVIKTPVSGRQAKLDLSIPDAQLWSPNDPALYDLNLELLQNGMPVDKVRSYFGIRTISADGNKILLNNKPIWLNMTLVQGYWPDGLLTPLSPEDFVKDIEWCKEIGLNGIRMHQKVEDPRFLYLCDKMGLLVWGEMANAAEGHFSERAVQIANSVWERTIKRDFNHPCIMTWTYSNEGWMHDKSDANEDEHYARAYWLLKKLDPTRLVIDNSGCLHVKTDIYDIHGHGNKEVISWIQGLGGPQWPREYQGQPFVRSEWTLNDLDKADETYYKDYAKWVLDTAKTEMLCGQCYVQLNDIENELNGYMTYDRKWKVDVKRVADIHAEATEIYETGLKK